MRGIWVVAITNRNTDNHNQNYAAASAALTDRYRIGD